MVAVGVAPSQRPVNGATVVRPIILIGFMGSGKTAVGRRLAAARACEHVDLDRWIEARVGPLLPFVRSHGEEAFRSLEREALIEVLVPGQRVVSLGGGTPCSFDNMAKALAAGTVVFIDAPLIELQERLLKKGRDRPLLFGLDDERLRDRVAALLAQRLPVYRRAHLIVDGSGDPASITQRILHALGPDQLR